MSLEPAFHNHAKGGGVFFTCFLPMINTGVELMLLSFAWVFLQTSFSADLVYDDILAPRPHAHAQGEANAGRPSDDVENANVYESVRNKAD